MSYYHVHHPCGCWYPVQNNYSVERKYLPQVKLSSSTNILATTSRTTLKQTFVNPEDKKLDEVQYTFPLYDGVSVVGFTCTVGAKTIVGVVKEKQQARVDYQEAIARGETAGLLEQLPEASDVFTTSLGNVPANERVLVEIVYLGELKHDAETDGARFTIPTIIAPRYGSLSGESTDALALHGKTALNDGGISISVDITLDQGTIVRGLQSPSHPIAVTMGRTSTMDEDAFSNNHASATLTLGTAQLDKDFVIVVLAKGSETPRALLETHPEIPHQRAIMTTLVPKFNIPPTLPEIVFVVDRSGSMEGKIELVVEAMKIFLKSLPVGAKFNICSFGSRYSFLFKKSKTYDQSSLKEALQHLNTFRANFGGTEMLHPVKATVQHRYNDLPLEVMILTDGEIWNQEELFTTINEATNARFFTLGIGDGASSALVEGIARAGNGFAQFVGENEKMDRRVVRMLKGALTPHISDYTLTITYGEAESISGDDDFEMVDAIGATKKPLVTGLKKPEPKKTISLFDTDATEKSSPSPAGRYDHLPDVPPPKVLQTPHKIPALFPFNRTTVYLLLGPDAPRRTPKAVTLRGTSDHGPLELEIPVQEVGVGETIHQLAAKKAIHELEQGRGWLSEARNGQSQLLKSSHEGKWDLIVEREAVRLGVQFQVGGKWCSFVAVEKNAQGVESSGTPPAYSENDSSPGSPGKRRVDLLSSSFPAQSRNRLASASGPGLGFPQGISFGVMGRTGAAPPPPLARPSAPAPAPASAMFQAPASTQRIQVSSHRSVASKACRKSSAGSKGGFLGGLGFGSGNGRTTRRSAASLGGTARNEDGMQSYGGGGGGGEGGVDASVEYGKEAKRHDTDTDMDADTDTATHTDAEKMHKLIDLQEFDGSWSGGSLERLIALLGVKADEVEKRLTTGSAQGEGDDAVKATALAVAWLKVKVPGEADVWEMVVEKALTWLEGRLGSESAKGMADAAVGCY